MYAQIYSRITHSAYFHCANVAHSTQAPGTSATTALLAIFSIARNAPLPHPWRTVAAIQRPRIRAIHISQIDIGLISARLPLGFGRRLREVQLFPPFLYQPPPLFRVAHRGYWLGQRRHRGKWLLRRGFA